MPTFEKPNEQGFQEWWLTEGILHMPSGNQPPEHAAIARLAWAAALQLRPPAASEERRQVADYLLAALPKFLGTAMDADDMREMAKIISDVQALHSAPSSPPPTVDTSIGATAGVAPSPPSWSKPPTGISSWLKDELKAAAAPSDAGQPALEKLRELVSHFEVKAIYYAELLKETGNLNFAGKQNAYEHAAEAVKIKLIELSPQPRTCQEEQD